MKKLEKLRERLESNTTKIGDCWIWLGQSQLRNGSEYGYSTFEKKNWRAHRLSYYAFTGKHPGDAQVMHSCDDGLCINPNHLSLGTRFDNMRDAARKGRLVQQNEKMTQCKHGHELITENVRIQFNRDGTIRRVCKECDRIKHRNLPPEQREKRRKYWRERQRKLRAPSE